MARGRHQIETWVFDLDNTLYCPSVALFAQINVRMTAFIRRELGVDEARADDLRGAYWRRYGTTLAGLVTEHDIAPEKFLEECHDIDLSGLVPDPALRGAIEDLPGRKIVHTNGPRIHAEGVLAARGLTGLFDAVIAIEDTGLVPKPTAAAYDEAEALTGINPSRALMIEDHVENLVEPKRRGTVTVWLHHGDDGRHGHVDHRIDDVVGFLQSASEGLPD
ncbi:MAG: pyrimidine 5'-nucleotidase [Pseudomonadota bacterium]